VFYAAILTLWLVALQSFLNISHFPGIVNILSVVITAAPFSSSFSSSSYVGITTHYVF
jgi:hypothetical protein